MAYTELQVTSNFSFLQGASHPEELVEEAARLGYTSIAVTDRNTLAGIVRAHAAAKKNGIRLIVGCRLDVQDGPSLLAFPTNQQAYAALSGLLTKGNLRTEKGKSVLYKTDLYQALTQHKLIVIPPHTLQNNWQLDQVFVAQLEEYQTHFGGHLYLAASRRYNGTDQKYLYQLAKVSKRLQIPLVATNDVYYHIAGRRQLQDVVTCVREKCTIYDAGFRLYPNAERYLKPQDEIRRLFKAYPEAIAATEEIASACTFSLTELKYEYPDEIISKGKSAQEQLEDFVWKGATECFGENIKEETVATIQYELQFIQKMNYASYFLTVYDIVAFARKKGILCQGRGSAANSTVCYCLGITSVNPTKFDLLFERFISDARNEPPDIDVDFEHERREEVMQYIFNKYGRDRAAIVATVTQQHQKGAIRDVAKAMGLSLDAINRLSKAVSYYGDDWFTNEKVTEQGFDFNDPHLQKILELTGQYMGFPRQLGQHTGGFVITRNKLHELCPIFNATMENRTCIEWNKDDIDTLGFMKVDVLALGMLTCIRKCFDLAKQHYNLELTLANIPQDDMAVYDMICKADTIGVFQIESRAQQSMLPRLKPRKFYDLVIEVAIVRPGPIQGDMVHPYLRRRNGEEPVDYPSEALKKILEKTLGVPLFQEQAMKIAMVAADFTPSEADELRRSMATFKVKGMVAQFQEKLVTGMKKNGYSAEYADRIFKQLEGFGSYGFPESHALSFALLVYVSSWLKCFYPDVFACGLLNSLPMGFYQPAQIIIDARNHGVEVKPVDINFSSWDNTLEEKSGKYCIVRLGFRQVKGLGQEEIKPLLEARTQHFSSIHEIMSCNLSNSTLEKLANADAFRSIGLDRRQALWELMPKDKPVALFKGNDVHAAMEKNIQLPLISLSEHVVEDYASTALSLKAHPVSFVREKLDQLHVVQTANLAKSQNGQPVRVAGLVLVRQKPETAKGVCFMTIEDETGFANLVIFSKVMEAHSKEVLHSRFIMVEGKLQREGDVIHVIVEAAHNVTRLLGKLNTAQNEQVFYGGRNFR